MTDAANKIDAFQERFDVPQISTELAADSAMNQIADDTIIVTGLYKNDDGAYKLIKSAKDGRAWEPPSGHIEEGESIPEAMDREFLEETGCLIMEKSPLKVIVWESEEKTVYQVVYKIDTIENCNPSRTSREIVTVDTRQVSEETELDLPIPQSQWEELHHELYQTTRWQRELILKLIIIVCILSGVVITLIKRWLRR